MNESINEQNRRRQEAFLDDYRKLVDKHQIDLAASLKYRPGGIIAKLIFVDLTNEEVSWDIVDFKGRKCNHIENIMSKNGINIDRAYLEALIDKVDKEIDQPRGKTVRVGIDGKGVPLETLCVFARQIKKDLSDRIKDRDTTISMGAKEYPIENDTRSEYKIWINIYRRV